MADLVDNFSDLQELGIDLDAEVSPLSKAFDKAAQHLQSLLATVDSETLLMLYGYYKQGQTGPCNITKPYWFDRKGKAKWEAWNKLGNMSQDEAKSMYIETIKSIDPCFECDPNEQGVKVSSLMINDAVASEDMTIVDYIKSGDSEKVEQLLKKQKNAVNELDETGVGLLHWATDSGFLDIVKILVNAGADVNLADVDGLTSLHYASSCGHSNCVEFLLHEGANPDILDNDGNKPYDLAASNDIQKLLS